MTYLKFIHGKQDLHNKTMLRIKSKHRKNIKKKDSISVGYHEYDKEEIKLDFYQGNCLRIKGVGINTKIVLNVVLDKTEVTLNFFFYNPFLFDLMKHFQTKVKSNK